jgi:hypothetical protein
MPCTVDNQGRAYCAFITFFHSATGCSVAMPWHTTQYAPHAKGATCTVQVVRTKAAGSALSNDASVHDPAQLAEYSSARDEVVEQVCTD